MTADKPDVVNLLLADWLVYGKEEDSFIRLDNAIRQAITAAVAEEHKWVLEQIEMFSKAAVAEERERCAKVAEDKAASVQFPYWHDGPQFNMAKGIAAAIRKGVKT